MAPDRSATVLSDPHQCATQVTVSAAILHHQTNWGEGTGLGLSISYHIVTQQHGGTITVEGEPGAFTAFTIRLPVQMFTNGGSRA
jgi:signal transduction histidine kinase